MGIKNVKVNGRRMSCLYVKNVPADLKSYFKAHCVKQEKTMTQVIIEFMLDCTKVSRQVDMASNESWPWCDACETYHHPKNKTCHKLRKEI